MKNLRLSRTAFKFALMLGALAALPASPAFAQTSGSNQIRMCEDVNSIDCADSQSSTRKHATGVSSVDGGEVEDGRDDFRSTLNDSSEVDGIIRATTYCLGPNGERIPNRTSLRFFFFERSADCAANSEIRECAAGILSGSATFAECSPLRGCVGPGYSLNHGQSGTFSNGPRAVSCVVAQRTCNDGTLGGNSSLTYFGGCTNFRSCTHQGQSIAHGATRDFFRVSQSTNCAGERTTVTCNDGTVTGSNLTYAQTTCSPPPANCTHQGQSIAHGATRNFWRVGVSTNCAAEQTTVSCNNGVVSGANLSYAQTSCRAPASCTHQGVAMAHGTSRNFFRVNLSTNCPGEQTTVTCNDGVVSGSNLSYNQTSCTAPVSCTHQGVAMAHGTSRAFFRVNVSPNCAAEQTTVSCNNGTVSGANLNYNQSSCRAPVGCTHHGVAISHGTSRQFFRVNQSANCPAEATTVSCNDGMVSGANLSYNQSSCAAPVFQTPQVTSVNEVYRASAANILSAAVSNNGRWLVFGTAIKANNRCSQIRVVDLQRTVPERQSDFICAGSMAQGAFQVSIDDLGRNVLVRTNKLASSGGGQDQIHQLSASSETAPFTLQGQAAQTGFIASEHITHTPSGFISWFSQNSFTVSPSGLVTGAKVNTAIPVDIRAGKQLRFSNNGQTAVYCERRENTREISCRFYEKNSANQYVLAYTTPVISGLYISAISGDGKVVFLAENECFSNAACVHQVRVYSRGVSSWTQSSAIARPASIPNNTDNGFVWIGRKTTVTMTGAGSSFDGSLYTTIVNSPSIPGGEMHVYARQSNNSFSLIRQFTVASMDPNQKYDPRSHSADGRVIAFTLPAFFGSPEIVVVRLNP